MVQSAADAADDGPRSCCGAVAYFCRVYAPLETRRKAKSEYLFSGRVSAGKRPEDAGPIVKVNAAHTAAVKRSKVQSFRLYDLRHTWATRMAQAGVDLVTLAAMLGHSKINMVLRYAHPTEEHQFAAMEKMQRYIAR